MLPRSAQIGLRPAVWLRPGENPFATQLELTIDSERRGFDGVFFGDRMLASVDHGERRIYSSTHTDLLVTLTAMAARTSTIMLGSLVLVLPFRHPVPLAKSLASLDLLSEGRLLLGVGSGWNAEEFAAVGVPRSERGGRMTEAIEVMRRLWRGGAVDFKGRWFELDGVAIEPQPARPGGPPIWLGSFTPARRELIGWPPDLDRVLARIGRVADGWVPVVYSQLTKRTVGGEVLARMWHRVQHHAEAAGRQGAVELAISHWYYVIENADDEAEARAALATFFKGSFDEARSTYLIGSAAEIVDRLGALAEGVATEVAWMIFSMLGPTTRQLDLLCDQVVPQVRQP